MIQIKSGTRCWIIKTTEGGPRRANHWEDFQDECVVAVGWSLIRYDPRDFVNRREQFIQQVKAKYGKAFVQWRGKPGHAASTIYKFANEWQNDDIAIICTGYAPNQTKEVFIYGVASVSQFSFDKRSKWWTFKRDADITSIKEWVPVRQLRPIFGGSLRKTIHGPFSERAFRAFSKLKKINPYLTLDTIEDRIAEAAEDARSLISGQGFNVTPELRKAIEALAVQKATRFFQSRGYAVRKVGKPYDLDCCKGKKVLRVEVKGTQTDGASVILTPNEVLSARKNSTALFILHSIRCRKVGKSTVPAGGEPLILNPWQIDNHGRLKALSYIYEISAKDL